MRARRVCSDAVTCDFVVAVKRNSSDAVFMRRAIHLARRGLGRTSPNPMVGAVLVKAGRIIGEGWHRLAGGAHAEVEAIHAASGRGHSTSGAVLYVSLEPCSTHGRTPPCSDAILSAGIRTVVVGATDPNPKHAGRGFRLLRRAGIVVREGVLTEQAARLNEAFNYWVVHRTPFVIAKAAMTLDGKIATSTGESKWITGERARAEGMRMRRAADAILVGVNTILADDPSLTRRAEPSTRSGNVGQRLRRIVLDTECRTPPGARVITDSCSHLTTVVTSRRALASRVEALTRRVQVLRAPVRAGQVDLEWLLKKLGQEEVTSLLVEGGGEVNASFLLGGLVQRVVFFYAPKILGGRDARKAVAGDGVRSLREAVRLRDVEWRRMGSDLMLTGLAQ